MTFYSARWKPICNLPSDDERADRTIDLMRKRIGARWATHIFMLRDRSNIRYILLHLTNHESGRDLIKEQLWKACPLASGANRFFARKSADHHQLQLIEDEPDPRPLRRMGPVPATQGAAALALTLWRPSGADINPVTDARCDIRA